MVFLMLLLAGIWVAFAFGVCVGDFFERELISIRPKTWYQEQPVEKPKAFAASA